MDSSSSAYSSYSSSSGSSYGYSSVSSASALEGPLRIRPRDFHSPLLAHTAASASSFGRLVLDREEISVLERCFGNEPIGARVLILCGPQEWHALVCLQQRSATVLAESLGFGPLIRGAGVKVKWGIKPPTPLLRALGFT